MSAILLCSIAIRVAAFALSLLLWRRLRDWRIGFLSGMILLMGLRQIFTLAQQPVDLPVSFVANIDELPGLVVSVLALVALVFVQRMLQERDSLFSSLHASEQRFRDFAQSSGDFFWEMDENLQFSYFSERFGEVSGVPPEALLGKTREETGIPNVDEAAWRQHLSDLGAHRPFTDFVHPRSKPGGETVWLSINGRPVFDADGGFRGYRGTGTDITKRRQVEEARRASETMFHAFLRNSPAEMFLRDADGRFVIVNRAWEKSQGMSAEQARGKRVHDIFPANRADIYAAQDVSVMNAGTILDQEMRFDFPEGERYFHIVKFPLIDAEGRTTGVGGITTEITRRKKTEEQLYQAQKMEAVGQLTGGIAHDFNNLLAVILGNADMLSDAVGEENRDRIEALTRAAQRGADLTRRLLAFSRKQILEPKIINANDVLADILTLLHRTLGEDIEIEAVTADDLWSCNVDPAQLENALLNLANNARDAMPTGGKLTIETANARLDDSYTAEHADVTPGQYVMVAVTDTGKGIPPEIREHVFEPFFTTKGLGAGSGLGLSMVFGFVKQSGGDVAIDSAEGEGTTVRLYLPRASAEVPAERQPRRMQEPAGRGETVLVVEDDRDVRALTTTQLGSLGYRVLEADTGPSALKQLGSTANVNLLLTDLVLSGGMNGCELAAKVRQSMPGVKVLYMSGYSENIVAPHGPLDAHAMLLRKPFRKRELASKVRATLDAD